jgi:pantetheine-phosphate adenylyltransferase
MEEQSFVSTKVLYPGTFDPPTLGHISIINRANRIFDKVIIAVAESSNKDPLFSSDQRVKLFQEIYRNSDSIEVIKFSGLLVALAKKLETRVILRGLRTVSDFEYEYKMATTNALVDENLETIFLMAEPQYGYISSTLVKQVARGGGDISPFVPVEVINKFKEGKKWE